MFAEVKEKLTLSMTSMPKHVAFSIETCTQQVSENQEEKNAGMISNLKNSIEVGTKLDIPVLTFQLHSGKVHEEDIDFLMTAIVSLNQWDYIHENQIKVTVLGKWYDLPNRLVSPIKELIDSTKDYDKFFINICLNYDGQEEIVDACKLIARQVKMGKIDPIGIDKNVVKENLYTSYFLPPDMIIKTGEDPSLHGFLLWDCADSKVYFTKTHWIDFDKDAFLNSIKWCQEVKK